MASKRNTFLEFLRFLFSILVVGYHVNESVLPNDTSVFEIGCLAVEFFFTLSGFFLAKSIEKVAKKSQTPLSLLKDTFYFMKGKIDGIIRLHIIVNILVIIILAIWDTQNLGDRLLKGIPGLFLVQNVIIWTDSTELIKPEWYLSAMLICMLIIFPQAVLLRTVLHQVWTTLILLGELIIILVVYGLISKWAFKWCFQCDLRAFAEMTFGILSLWLSTHLTKKEFGKTGKTVMIILELVLYGIPLILGIIPIPDSLTGAGIGITVVCSFFGVIISFAGKGIQVSGKLEEIFAFLGTISLPIYLFHPPVIYLFEYTHANLNMGVEFILVFLCATALSIGEMYLHKAVMLLIDRIRGAKPAEPVDHSSTQNNGEGTQSTSNTSENGKENTINTNNQQTTYHSDQHIDHTDAPPAATEEKAGPGP